MATSSLPVAKTILAQLGGNKFIAMTGSKNFVGDDTSLSMKLTRNKAKATHLKITLTPMDTYDVEFLKITNPTARNKFQGKRAVVVKHEDIYFDSLQELFTDVTGLYTKF